MADEVKLINQLADLPSALQTALEDDITPYAECPTDTSDCTEDESSCTSDVCPGDSNDCAPDSSSCTSDCTDCSDCSDCSDCTDCSDTATWSGSYSITNVTSTSVTIYVSGLSSGDSVRFFIRLSSDASDTTVDSTYTASSSTMTQSFSGLAPKTAYAVNVCVDGTWGSSKTFTTKASGDRPDDWEFTSTIASGAAIALTAVEWNDFCIRINEFRTYRELSEATFTIVSSGDPISAAVVNEAVTAISEIPDCGTLPDRAYSGDPIAASFFNQLTIALNSVP